MENEYSVSELIEKSYEIYEKALELLSRGDYYDAAEKAWSSIEYMRKAFLVALNVPYSQAKTINKGLILFSDILRKLNRRDLLRIYDQLMLRLHILGFYEQIISADEIDEIIHSVVSKFLAEMKKLIESIKGINMRRAVEFLDKMNKVKQEISSRSAELYEIRREYINYIERALVHKTD
ncbi:MAG: PaREP1 family protein [Candidatus Njordarchaeota archaeon]